MNDQDRSPMVVNNQRSEQVPVLIVLLTFLRLGLTSFGGPVAHLGFFREAFVVRRRWLDEFAYADLVALCQFLPGPASSQVGIGIGLAKAGLPGAFAAWLGFTLPSASETNSASTLCLPVTSTQVFALAALRDIAAASMIPIDDNKIFSFILMFNSYVVSRGPQLQF